MVVWGSVGTIACERAPLESVIRLACSTSSAMILRRSPRTMGHVVGGCRDDLFDRGRWASTAPRVRSSDERRCSCRVGHGGRQSPRINSIGNLGGSSDHGMSAVMKDMDRQILRRALRSRALGLPSRPLVCALFLHIPKPAGAEAIAARR